MIGRKTWSIVKIKEGYVEFINLDRISGINRTAGQMTHTLPPSSFAFTVTIDEPIVTKEMTIENT